MCVCSTGTLLTLALVHIGPVAFIRMMKDDRMPARRWIIAADSLFIMFAISVNPLCQCELPVSRLI